MGFCLSLLACTADEEVIICIFYSAHLSYQSDRKKFTLTQQSEPWRLLLCLSCKVPHVICFVALQKRRLKHDVMSDIPNDHLF